jgi:cyclase
MADTTHQLVVAKMNPHDASAVADIFAKSDSSELPGLIGVRRRTLFSFHDLYCHFIEADLNFSPALYKARGHPLYAEINQRLAEFISPYDPNWKEPKDAMAMPFYAWTADNTVNAVHDNDNADDEGQQ